MKKWKNDEIRERRSRLDSLYVDTHIVCWNSDRQYVHLTTGKAPRHSCEEKQTKRHKNKTIVIRITATRRSGYVLIVTRATLCDDWNGDRIVNEVRWNFFFFFSRSRERERERETILTSLFFDFIAVSLYLVCYILWNREREEKKLTLHSCWPGDNSSKGCLEKHLEQANNACILLPLIFTIVRSLVFSLFEKKKKKSLFDTHTHRHTDTDTDKTKENSSSTRQSFFFFFWVI